MPYPKIPDEQLELFRELHEIDDADHDVSEWEAEFLASVLRQEVQKRALSDRQVEVARKMIDKYIYGERS